MSFLDKIFGQKGAFLLITVIWSNHLRGITFALIDPQTVLVDMIVKNGYPIEEHVNLETEDGYLLDIHRIPHGRKDNANGSYKPAVLLMHGLLGSAENWIVTGPGKGLAFILADLGYDVWLGNARGTTHSRKHKTLSPDSSDFWEFSWHEIGIYDLPAQINYIIKVTGQPSIYYIGHSQGTTTFFVMASERPEYNAKIRLMIALSPAVFMSHLWNPFFQVISRIEGTVNWMLSLVGGREFLANSRLLSMAGQTLCSQRAPIQAVCTNLLFLITGYDSVEMNKTSLPVILSASPAGASTKQILHFAQSINSGAFRYYDYGMLMNLFKYNSISPPHYKLGLVSAPVVLFYAKNDWLVSIRDVKILESKLPNVVYSYLIPYKDFNHLDFLWASDIVPMVYYQVLNLLKEF